MDGVFCLFFCYMTMEIDLWVLLSIWSTVIVAPITSRIHTKAKLPTHTLINDFEGLDKNSIILLEQVRTIDKQRLKQYLGMIPDDIVARVDKALAISVALEKTKATDV